MRKLVLTRPKSKEKYYDESKIRIYINGELVEKLGQNETRVVPVEMSEIQLQAKHRGCKTPAEIFGLDNGATKLEIYRTKYTQSHYLVGLPVLLMPLYNSGISILRIISIVLLLLAILWGVFAYRRDRYASIFMQKIS